jgi:FKBP-type peptidyl-prolyl cis-trans isomerase
LIKALNKMKNNWYVLLLFPLASCNLNGVDTDTPDLDSNIVEATIDTLNEVDENALKPDSINGSTNEMVYQRADGLRVEWDIKNDDRIKENDVVMVNYSARVAAGEEYDSNKKVGKPWPLKAGIGMMLPGWEDGLLQMNIGDKGRIMIPNALAYGPDGYNTIVPPDADIIVDIEIISRIDPIKLKDGVKVYKYESVVDGAKPSKNQTITFDYFAYQLGKNPGIYDNSYQHENPFSFKFKNDKVVDGLHIGMSVMKPSENAFIQIPYKAAYGSKGLLDLVPSKTDIVYDVRVATIE